MLDRQSILDETFSKRVKLTIKQRILGVIEEPPAPPKQETVIGTYSGYDLERWQASNEHIQFARTLFKEPLFQDLLSVLQNSRPSGAVLNLDSIAAARALGWREGYDMLLSRLFSLTQFPPQPSEEIPADYGATPIPES